MNAYRRDHGQIPELQTALEREKRSRDQTQQELDQEKRGRRVAEKKASELAERVRSVEKQMGRAQQEREKLNTLHRSQVGELEESRMMSNRLQQELRRQGEIERTCQDLHEQVVKYVGEL